MKELLPIRTVALKVYCDSDERQAIAAYLKIHGYNIRTIGSDAVYVSKRGRLDLNEVKAHLRRTLAKHDGDNERKVIAL